MAGSPQYVLTIHSSKILLADRVEMQFSSIIVNGFGFSPLNSLLVQMPGGVFQLSGLAFISLTSTYVKNTRVICMIAMVTLSLIGMIMVYTVSNEHKYTRLAGIWLSAIFAADIPMALSLITSNVGGFTKRATVSAMLFIGYCTGNIIGPQFFYTREKPKYPVSTTVCFWILLREHC